MQSSPAVAGADTVSLWTGGASSTTFTAVVVVVAGTDGTDTLGRDFVVATGAGSGNARALVVLVVVGTVGFGSQSVRNGLTTATASARTS